MNVLSLPFFQTYVAGRPKYVSYLNAAYTQSISSKSLGLSLVESLSKTELAQALASDRPKAQYYQKNAPNSILNFGFWILDVGVAMLHVTIFI